MEGPVVVAGAGLAGLTAAALLARAGRPVTVLDASGAPGGRARTTERGGHLLNLGPHGLALSGPGTAVLRELGIELPGRSPARTRSKLLVGGAIVHALDRRRGGPGARASTTILRLARASRRDPDGTVAELLDVHVPDDDGSRGLARGLARLATYADSLDEQAADVFTEQTRAGRVRYLDGGWQALVARLSAAAVAAGARIRLGSPLRHVQRDVTGRVVGAHLVDGSVLPATAVIVATGGPGDAAEVVSGDAGARLRDWAQRVAPVRMACLDVALEQRPAGPSLVLGVDEPLYLSVHSDVARLAPEPGAVVHAAMMLPLGASAPEGARGRLEELVDLALPGWRDVTVHARYLPGLVVTHDAARACTGGRRGRPGPSVPSVPGLYVAGDWVGTRGYLAQASLASAGATAQAILSGAEERAGAGEARRASVSTGCGR